MAKKPKRGPALLEVMQGKVGKIPAAPGFLSSRWLRRDKRSKAAATVAAATVDPLPAATPAPAEATAPAEPPPVPPRAKLDPPSMTPPRSPQSSRSAANGKDRVIAFDQGRIRLSLSPFSAVIIIGWLFILVFLGYVVGVKTAPTRNPLPLTQTEPAASSIQDALSAPVNPSVTHLPRHQADDSRPGARKPRTGGKPISKPSVAAVTADPRTQGLNYLLIITATEWKDVTSAQAFLGAHRVDTTIVQDKGRWKLYDVTRGYRYSADEAAWRSRQKYLASLTDKYRNIGGRYRFDDTQLELYNPGSQ